MGHCSETVTVMLQIYKASFYSDRNYNLGSLAHFQRSERLYLFITQSSSTFKLVRSKFFASARLLHFDFSAAAYLICRFAARGV